MKYALPLLALTGLVILQSALLPLVFPWLPLAPALVCLVFASIRQERRFLLIASLWTGLVMDILLGEILGLYMLLNFVSMFIVLEIKYEVFESYILTVGIRLIAATLIQDVFMAFIFYIQGIPDLIPALQINAGMHLLSNLILYLLSLLVIKLRHPGDKLESVLEVKR